MTLYEKILTFDVDAMAEFVTELVTATEDRFLESMDARGVKASIVRSHRDLLVLSNRSLLLQEAQDDNT